MSEYKNQVPESRTIVPGIWSDILDNWKDTFVNIENGTSQKVTIDNISELMLILTKAFIESEDQNARILEQLRLMNMRIEEAFNTRINEGDL